MDAKTTIMKTLREQVVQKPYSDLTVNELIDLSGVSRKTFYKYFDGKQGVLKEVILEDTVNSAARFMKTLYQEQLEANTAMAMEITFMTFYRYKDFYKAMFADRSRSSVRKLIVTAQYEFSKTLFFDEAVGDIQPVDALELDYACWFFASSLTNSLEWWIDHDFHPSSREMAALHDSWTYARNSQVGHFRSAPTFTKTSL